MSGAISQDRESCQFPSWLMKNPILDRAARPESGQDARERFLRAPFALNSSERRRRLALAGGFRLLCQLSSRLTPRSTLRRWFPLYGEWSRLNREVVVACGS